MNLDLQMRLLYLSAVNGVFDGLSADGGIELFPPARGEYVLVLFVPAALHHLAWDKPHIQNIESGNVHHRDHVWIQLSSSTVARLYVSRMLLL